MECIFNVIIVIISIYTSYTDGYQSVHINLMLNSFFKKNPNTIQYDTIIHCTTILTTDSF